ncbi:MAG: hypothetical protein JWQ19_1337 [Subtercola sp.]|nr:hypothetical protein [Subtercola sp.]
MICLAELHFGVEAAPDAISRADRTRRLSRLRGAFDWVPFDEYAAEAYGVFAATVSRTRPGHARSKDIMIAAQAYSLGVPLMTRNVKNFELISHTCRSSEPNDAALRRLKFTIGGFRLSVVWSCPAYP